MGRGDVRDSKITHVNIIRVPGALSITALPCSDTLTSGKRSPEFWPGENLVIEPHNDLKSLSLMCTRRNLDL